jgi:crossover junction endodeoxyribonuclease RuvC
VIRILGIDPGSVITGWGLVESDGARNRHLAHGHIRVRGDSLPDKLGCIFAEIGVLIDTHQPAEFAIEQVFVAHNAMSALKLGQARGAAICAAATRALPVSEYEPRLVKQAIVGSGAASKEQVQHMVGVLLNLDEKLQADAADGLAIALCHGHLRGVPPEMRVSTRRRRSRRR